MEQGSGSNLLQAPQDESENVNGDGGAGRSTADATEQPSNAGLASSAEHMEAVENQSRDTETESGEEIAAAGEEEVEDEAQAEHSEEEEDDDDREDTKGAAGESSKEQESETPAAEGTKEGKDPVPKDKTATHSTGVHSPLRTGAATRSSSNSEQQQDQQASRMVPVPTFGDTFQSIDDKTRKAIHAKLRAYENKRRTAYFSKLESSTLYWRSFRDLLHSSVYETSRAERILIGTAKANQVYAESMQASYDDCFLDDRGNTVLDFKKQQVLMEARSQQNYDVPPLMPDEKKRPPSTERKNNILHSLLESQLDLASKFGDQSKRLQEEIVEEITDVRVALTRKVLAMRKLGDVIISELERTEQEVSEAWEAYYAMATKILGGTNMVSMAASREMRAGASSSPSAAGGVEEKKDVLENCQDLWVVEMQYRVVVAYQQTAWERGSTELSKLFSQMKETEVERRIHLREYLVAFVQRQEKLFAQLPDIHTPALKELIGREMDRTKLETAVQEAIKKRAQARQREEAKYPRKDNSGSGLSDVDPALGSFKLESPLLSDLMCKAKVIEKKGTGMIAQWKAYLAVITADSFLHLFDLPTNSGLTIGSAPEVAFQTLVPKPAPATPSSAVGESSETLVKGWCDPLTPVESMVLANCTINTLRNSAAFDIAETTLTKGASVVFGKTASKKVTLRCVTKQETADWIAVLKAQK